MAVIAPWNAGSTWTEVLESWRAGKVVGFPTDSGYVAAGCALSPLALEALRRIAPDERLTLTLTYPVETHDWLPYLRGAGVRLARHFWPGPVILIAAAGL